MNSTCDVGIVFSSPVEFCETQRNEWFTCCLDFLSGNQNPGVAPPDGALLFCWPKRVSRKGPALRWACLAHQGGNLNSGCSDRSRIQVYPTGDEALVSLSFCGGLHLLLQSFFKPFPCKSHKKVRPFDTGPGPHHRGLLTLRKPGQGDALRKEKALLHTFVAGQKYGVGRDATGRFCFEGLKKNNKGNR